RSPFAETRAIRLTSETVGSIKKHDRAIDIFDRRLPPEKRVHFPVPATTDQVAVHQPPPLAGMLFQLTLQALDALCRHHLLHCQEIEVSPDSSKRRIGLLIAMPQAGDIP